MSRGHYTKCSDCGTPMKAVRGTLRAFCRKCRRRHAPKSKTYAIIKSEERILEDYNAV